MNKASKFRDHHDFENDKAGITKIRFMERWTKKNTAGL